MSESEIMPAGSVGTLGLSVNARVFRPAQRARTVERTTAVLTVLLPHLGLVAGVLMAQSPSFDWRAALWFWLAGHVLRGFGIAIGIHRLVSHASFKTKPWLRVVLAVLGMTAAQGPVLWWAAIHRRHHGTTERDGDPHSPYVKRGAKQDRIAGFIHAHVGWLFEHEITSWRHYIPDLLKDRALYAANRLYPLWMLLGVVLPGVVAFALHPTSFSAAQGAVFGGLIAIATMQHSTWAVNSVCHVWGTRPYCTGGDAIDKGRNNVIVALLTVGDGWHNHHHAFPSTAINQFRFWQFDPAGWVIRSLEVVGLAWDVKMPSPAVRQLSVRRKRALPPLYTTGWGAGRDPRLGTEAVGLDPATSDSTPHA